MAAIQLPVLPMRQGGIEGDVDVIYRYLQAVIQLLSGNVASALYLTAEPTINELPQGQWALGFVGGDMILYINDADSIKSVNLGTPV